MKLATTFIQFYSPQTDQRKFISLEQLIVFGITDIRDAVNGKMFRVDDNLYLFIKESKQYVKMVSEEMYWRMYKLAVDCS
jgi:hypothetical protein